MKKTYLIFVILCTYLFTSNAQALHGNPAYSGIIEHCSLSGLCITAPSIEEGSAINAQFSLETFANSEEIGSVINYTIEIIGPSETLILNMDNSFILFENFTASVDELEFTEFTSGLISIDTSTTLTSAFGTQSELRFNFDQNRIDFYVLDTLAASTSPVPIPSAVWLFGSS